MKPNSIGAIITFERSRIKPSLLIQCCQGGCKYAKQKCRCARWKKIELCRTFSVFLFRFASICQRPRPQCVCVAIHHVFYGIRFRTQFNFFGSWSSCWRQHGSKHSGQVIPLSVVFLSTHILCPPCVLTAERGGECCHAERIKPLLTPMNKTSPNWVFVTVTCSALLWWQQQAHAHRQPVWTLEEWYKCYKLNTFQSAKDVWADYHI